MRRPSDDADAALDRVERVLDHAHSAYIPFSQKVADTSADTSGDGRPMQTVSKDTVSQDIENMVKHVTILDTTGDGRPDTLAADSSGDGKYDTIHKAFKYMDQDGSGFINRSEFEWALAAMNVNIRKAVLDSLLDIIDVEDDGDGGTPPGTHTRSVHPRTAPCVQRAGPTSPH